MSLLLSTTVKRGYYETYLEEGYNRQVEEYWKTVEVVGHDGDKRPVAEVIGDEREDFLTLDDLLKLQAPVGENDGGKDSTTKGRRMNGKKGVKDSLGKKARA